MIQKKNKIYTPAQINEILEFQHLNLGDVTKLKTLNIFHELAQDAFYRTRPHFALIKVMRDQLGQSPEETFKQLEVSYHETKVQP